ncbi:uncharacterized protein K444DRAFT_613736 [Hyaloscypha bicolor E]|uniref:Uncharacterized protein n=1 Tax=Hyaloscypha bicolor E TaxID=1095630 RepID=A0A2J6T7D7_9HELO|nr:uncharacterized protein K444DRAFT_613736 [Hyaloscypha bicolor E]PMD58939.1 hypothetical protein K444DRAFT_613736 [Hyaloscypha bicolor E]
MHFTCYYFKHRCQPSTVNCQPSSPVPIAREPPPPSSGTPHSLPQPAHNRHNVGSTKAWYATISPA